MTAKYMLDTNICIYIMKRQPIEVVERMDQCRLGEVVMSSITYGELEFGVLMAANPTAARTQLDILIQAAPVVPFNDAAAKAYAPIRQATKDRKKDALDKMIAGHAVSLDLTVVTNNVDDFKVYPGVKIENWVK